MNARVSCYAAIVLCIAAHPASGEDAETRSTPLRIAVYDFQVEGIEARQGRVVMTCVLQELRKLERVSVIGSDEIRAMLDHEANKQLLGCAQDSCLAEIADALGADALVIGSLTRVADEHVFGMRRLDPKKGETVSSMTRRFEAGNGEEFLVSIGPGVQELFPEVPLRAGLERGVASEMALRLNPPPLPAWVFWSGTGVTTALAVAAGGFGIASVAAADDHSAYVASGQTRDLDPKILEEKADAADNFAYATIGLGSAAAALALASGVAALFTDFWGYAEMNQEAAR